MRERGPRAVEFDAGTQAQKEAEEAAWSDNDSISPMYRPGVQAVPSADLSIRRVTMPPQAPPTSQSSVENIPSTPVVRPAKARLSPELELAFDAWNEGATSVDKLEKTLGITHHHAYKLYRQLRELRLI